MQLLGHCGAGIVHHRHEIPQITGISGRGLYALVGIHTAEVKRSDAEVAEHVVQVGAREYAAGRFVDDDFITSWRHFLWELSFFASGGCKEVKATMTQTTVTAILGQRADSTVNDLEHVFSEGLLELLDAGNDNAVETAEIVASPLLWNAAFVRICKQPPAIRGIQILHVDAHQGDFTLSQVLRPGRVGDERLAIILPQGILAAGLRCVRVVAHWDLDEGGIRKRQVLECCGEEPAPLLRCRPALSIRQESGIGHLLKARKSFRPGKFGP